MISFKPMTAEKDGSENFVDQNTAVQESLTPSDPSNPEEHVIVVTGQGDGSVTVNKTSAIAGTLVSISASPNPGSKFNNWGAIRGTPAYTKPPTSKDCHFYMPNTDVIIVGYFCTDDGSGVAGGGSGGYVPTEETVMSRAISVPSIVDYYTDEQLNTDYHRKEEYEQAINKYGNIFKVVSFSDTTDKDKLIQYGREWIRRNYYDGVISFTITALDFRVLGYNAEKMLCGDRIPVTFIDDDGTRTTKTLTCLSVRRDLLKPENTQFKIGIPGVSDNPKYREVASLGNGTIVSGSSKNDTKTLEQQIQELYRDAKEKLKQTSGIDLDNIEVEESYF